MLPKIKSYMHIRMYMHEFSIWTSKLVKGESHLGQLTSRLVASSMRRKSFLVTTNKLQIWSVWIVPVCICLECNLLEIKKKNKNYLVGTSDLSWKRAACRPHITNKIVAGGLAKRGARSTAAMAFTQSSRNIRILVSEGLSLIVNIDMSKAWCRTAVARVC